MAAPDLTDAEIFLAIGDRADATEISIRLAGFADRIAECGDEIDVLREQLREVERLPEPAKTKRLIVLTRLSSRVSDTLSRLVEERAAYISTILPAL